MTQIELNNMKLVAAILERMHEQEDDIFNLPELGGYYFSRVQPGIWQHRETGKICTSLVEAYALEVGTNVHAATMELAANFGHFAESCFTETIREVIDLADSIPEHFGDFALHRQIPETCHYEQLTFVRKHIHTLAAPDGRVSGFIAFYALGDTYFSIPFFVREVNDIHGKKLALRMGMSQGHKRPINQKKMRDLPHAALIYCSDPIVAAALDDYQNNLAASEMKDQAIVVGASGSGSIDLRYFAGRLVYFIPAAYEKGFVDAGQVGHLFEKNEALVKICTVPVVACDQGNPKLHSIWDRENKYCRTQAAFTEERTIFKTIFENSIPLQEYAEWLEYSGIKDNCPPVILPLVPGKPIPARVVSMPALDAESLSAMVIDRAITLIQGKDNQARSIFALNLAFGLDLGVDTFWRFVRRPTRRVLYIDTASHWESDVWYERMEADFPKHGIVRVKLCEILSASNNSGLPVEPSELAQILVARYRTARAEVLCLDSLESLFPTCTPQEHLEKFLALVESWQNTMSDPIVCCCAEGFFSNEAVDAFVDNRILVEDPRTPGGTFTEDNRRQFDTFISLPRVCLKVTVQKMVEAQYLEGKYFCYFLPDSSDMDPPGWRYFVLTERVQENGEDVFIEGNWSEVETTPEKAHDFLFRGISRADDE